jgi:hypothetical protein
MAGKGFLLAAKQRSGVHLSREPLDLPSPTTQGPQIGTLQPPSTGFLPQTPS